MQLGRFFAVAVFAVFALLSGKAEPRPLDSYNSIIDRNPFGLKDPPPPLPPPATNAPKSDVKKEEFYLTGISTIGNAKHPKAYLLAKDTSKKDFNEKFYNLTVGDRQGELTLLEVDTKGRRVKVAYLGEEKWLSMKDNSVPGPVGGPPPGVPGLPGGVSGGLPVPLPNSPSAAPQPLSYPNGNNSRTPRTAGSYSPGGYSSGAMNPAMAEASTSVGAANNKGFIPSSPTAITTTPGPQTEEEVLKQIVTLPYNSQDAASHGIPFPPIHRF